MSCKAITFWCTLYPRNNIFQSLIYIFWGCLLLGLIYECQANTYSNYGLLKCNQMGFEEFAYCYYTIEIEIEPINAQDSENKVKTFDKSQFTSKQQIVINPLTNDTSTHIANLSEHRGKELIIMPLSPKSNKRGFWANDFIKGIPVVIMDLCATNSSPSSFTRIKFKSEKEIYISHYVPNKSETDIAINPVKKREHKLIAGINQLALNILLSLNSKPLYISIRSLDKYDYTPYIEILDLDISFKDSID